MRLLAVQSAKRSPLGVLLGTLALLIAVAAWSYLTAPPAEASGTGRWQLYTPTPTASTLRAVSAFDANIAYVVGDGGTILRTDDGGASWSAQASGVGTALLGVVMGGTDRVVAVGAGGEILYTGDAGATWTSVGGVTTSTLRAVTRLIPFQTVAVGDGGTVVYATTPEKRRYWAAGSSGVSSDLHGVAANSAGELYAVGSGGTIITSADQGQTWSAVASPTTRTLYGVAFMPTNDLGWAVGAGGVILRTEDGGVTWDDRSIAGVTTDLHGVVAMNEKIAYAVGAGGTIFATSDGGDSWTNETQSGQLYGVGGVDAAHVWAVGGSGTIYASTAGPCTPSSTAAEYWKPYFSLGSAEGLVWTGITDDTFKDGTDRGVPRVMVLPSGDMHLFHSAPGSLDVALSTDGGKSWGTPAASSLTGAGDVAVVYLDDGRIRLLFAVGSFPTSTATGSQTVASAISCDGTTFVREAGTRYTPPSGDDGAVGVPTAIEVIGSSDWRMYYVGDPQCRWGTPCNNTRSATSSDQGWTWTSDLWSTPTETDVVDPDVVYIKDASGYLTGYRLYYKYKYLDASTSPPTPRNEFRAVDLVTGVDFDASKVQTLTLDGATFDSSGRLDPAVVRDARGGTAGTLRMFYGASGGSGGTIGNAAS